MKEQWGVGKSRMCKLYKFTFLLSFSFSPSPLDFTYLTEREKSERAKAEGQGEAGFPLSRGPNVGLNPRVQGF